MNIDKAIEEVAQEFPFQNYMTGDDDSYRNISATVKKWLPSGGRILDFASGPCDKTAILQKMGYQCSACDDLSDPWHHGNEEKIKEYTQSIGIDFHLLKDRTLPYQSDTYDMVMAHAVLDHLHDSPRELMNKLVDFIKPGGYLFVSLPNAVNIRKRLAVLRGRTNMPPYENYYWYPGHWRGHVREYVRDDLTQMAKYLQLETVELRGCHHMARRVSSSIRPVYYALTALFDGWRDSWTLVARKPQNWEPKLRLSDQEMNRIVGVDATHLH